MEWPTETPGWYGYGVLEIDGGFGVRKLSVIRVDRITAGNARPSSKVRWPEVFSYLRSLNTPSFVTYFLLSCPSQNYRPYTRAARQRIFLPFLPPRHRHGGGTEFPHSLQKRLSIKMDPANLAVIAEIGTRLYVFSLFIFYLQNA